MFFFFSRYKNGRDLKASDKYEMSYTDSKSFVNNFTNHERRFRKLFGDCGQQDRKLRQ